MIAAAAIILSREYEKNQRKRLFEFSEFARLTEHIKLKISCFLSPKSDWLSDFYSESEAVREFLSLASKSSLSESFSAVKGKLYLEDESAVFEGLFSALGKSYKEGETAMLERAEGEIFELSKVLFPECENNIKTVRVLSAAISLGLIILLI